ncbi:hypothetical protein FACS1894120_1370 [Clostridia bacterium]|nr:hypothetical protein FACS1894120_1370 [Clostridia bacterium]
MQNFNARHSKLSLSMVSWVKSCELEYLITEIIRTVKIPTKISGYYYLRQSILTLVELEGACIYSAGKLYKEVAKKFNTSAEQVERCARHALNKAWNDGTLNNVCSILEISSPLYTMKPSAYMFITDIANILCVYRNMRLDTSEI